jgi:serine/threonine-protein kinase HipA
MIYPIQLNFVRKPQIELKKLSIQGVQPKLSAAISIVDQEFKIVDQFGTYIIKPQNDLFPQLPENEDVTMRMAKCLV